MKFNTLLNAVNNFYSFPTVIKCKRGNDRVKDASNMISKKQVQINGYTITDNEALVKSGDYIRITTKNKEGFIVY